MKTTERSTYRLELRDAARDDAGPDVNVRLRRALKVMLRTFGLRCTSISEVGRTVTTGGFTPQTEASGKEDAISLADVTRNGDLSGRTMQPGAADTLNGVKRAVGSDTAEDMAVGTRTRQDCSHATERAFHE